MTLKELKMVIKKAATIYYTGEFEGVKYDKPIMSDAQFDQYVAWLRSMDPHAEELQKPGWGYDPKTVSGDKVHHLHGGMDSIDSKPRDIEDIPSRLRYKRVRISAKLDGLSGKLEFVEGKFVRCTTRGNGEIGIDKTDKFEFILNRVGGCSVPEAFTGEIRGEFVISHQNWEKMLAEGCDKSHPRNAASGLIGADDESPFLKYLDFVPYKVIWDKFGVFPHRLDAPMDECFLCDWFANFPKLPKAFVDEYTADDLMTMYSGWKEVWPIDGLVITSTEIDRRPDGRYVYDEIAYKFESLKKVTKVVGINWQMSKHSKLTPVANLEPIEIDGAVISRVTLNNAQYVETLGITVGSEVEIMRSGGVIPYLTQVVSIPEGATFEIPETCPVCGSDLHRRGVDVVCTAPYCGNVDAQNLRIWVSTLGAVDGIADTLTSEFLTRFNINSIADLYAAGYDTFKPLAAEGVQANKFLLVIDKLMNAPVDLKSYLLALNIPRLGDVTAKKLAASSNFVECIQKLIQGHAVDNATWSLVISSIAGDATAATIIDNIAKFDTVIYIKDRLVVHSALQSSAASSEPVPVCITGTLSRPRKTIVSMLEEAGYVVKEDVTKKTKYLITNDVNGSSGKHKRANELGTQKITEDELLAILSNK